MKKLIILLFSIFISINSYGGVFYETVCFETSGQNIVFLPNDIYPYSGKYLCKFDNGQKEQEGRYKDGILIGKWTV
jgi:antitoxin component YwqK of YwqJK toxin-antitoxin module